jgi:molybdenum cofactor cytidylyltransferase
MQPFHTIAPIILAAGDSTRMGYPKALLPLGPDLFLTRILKTVRNVGLPTPTIILGREAKNIRMHLTDWPANIKINPDPGRGQLSSIQLALAELAPEFNAGMIWPVDQPALSESLVADLVRLFISSGALIACPVYGARRGHPAIFHRILFREFLDTPLSEGPKHILVRHQQATALLPADEPATVKDIDTPSDYESLTGISLNSALGK